MIAAFTESSAATPAPPCRFAIGFANLAVVSRRSPRSQAPKGQPCGNQKE